MSQFYVGTKRIFAYPQEKNGLAGYAVIYDYGTAREYTSWSPKEVFEAAYVPMGHGNDGSKITQEMVDNFILSTEVKTLGEKTTVVLAKLRNGFDMVESSACVDVKNYDESLGAKLCLQKIKDRIWHLLGFTLQWAKDGIS